MRILALLMVLALAQGDSGKKPQSKPPATKTAAKTDIRGTAQSPIVVQMVRTAQDTAVAREQRKQKQKKAFYDLLIGWGTAALAVFTLVLSIATIILARFTYKLWQETKNMATAASTDAKAMHTRMDTQARIMDETKERSLRAYMTIESTPALVGDGGSDGAAHYQFFGSLKNRGQTPAYHVRNATRQLLMDSKTALAITDLSEEPSIGVLGPDHEIELSEREPTTVSPADLAAIKAGTKRLYFVGYVLYEDAFKKGWKQRFCHFLSFHARHGEPISFIAALDNDEACIYGHEPHEDHKPGAMH